MKKIFVHGSNLACQKDSGFILLQTVLVILIVSLLFAATVHGLKARLTLLEKQNKVLTQRFELVEENYEIK